MPGETVDYIQPQNTVYVAGIAASSDDKYTGIAPGADIIALKTRLQWKGQASWTEASLQWCINTQII